MIGKAGKYITVGVSAVLVVFTLVFKVLRDNLHVIIPDSDNFLVNMVFIFSMLAGIMTWGENRHISLALLKNENHPKLCSVFSVIVDFVNPAVLSAVFFTAMCQLVNPDQLTSTIFFIPSKFFFAFLPLCYLVMIASSVRCSRNKTASVAGILFGLVISVCSVTGILYYLNAQGDFFDRLCDFQNSMFSLIEKSICPVIIVFVVLAFIGVPLFVVIGGITYFCFCFAGGYVDVIPVETYRILTDKSVAAIPLFTMAGYILSKSSAGRRFISLFDAMFGFFRGGTVVASVIVMAFFTTFTGVSGVTILALGSLLSVILSGSGYTKDKAESLITSCGALGLLFPPSVAIIMYGTVNYFSVDVFDLFKGSFIPGVIMSLSMIAVGVFYDKRTEFPKFSFRKIAQALKECWAEILLPAIICITYFAGIFDLLQVSSFAVVYSLLISLFLRKDFGVGRAVEIVAESIPVTGGILFILSAASGLSYYILDANIPYVITDLITQFISNKYLFLFLMNVLLLVVGCLMDIYSAILIVSPLLLPVAESFGISPVQTGVIFLMNLSIGFLTPPVGMDLFISSYTFKKPMNQVIRGVLPFLAVQLLILMLVTYVPVFTTVLL